MKAPISTREHNSTENELLAKRYNRRGTEPRYAGTATRLQAAGTTSELTIADS
jgi:hypothetical protein